MQPALLLALLGAGPIVLAGPAAGVAGGGHDRLKAVTIGRDGAVVAVGWTAAPGGGTEGLIARAQGDGRWDPGFGEGGLMRFSHGAYTALSDVAIDADGSIVVVGAAGPDRWRTTALAARLHPDGRLQARFETPAALPQHPDGTKAGWAAVVIGEGGRVFTAGAITTYAKGPAWWVDGWLCRAPLAAWSWCRPRRTATLTGRYHGGEVAAHVGDPWHTGRHDALLDLIGTSGGLVAAGWAAGPTYDEERSLVIGAGGGTLGAAQSAAGGAKEVLYAVASWVDGGVATAGFSFGAGESPVLPLVELRDARQQVVAQYADPQFGDGALAYFTAVATHSNAAIAAVGFTDDRRQMGDAVDRAIAAVYGPDLGRWWAFDTKDTPLLGGSDDAFFDVAIDRGGRLVAAGTSQRRATLTWLAPLTRTSSRTEPRGSPPSSDPRRDSAGSPPGGGR